MRPRMSSGVVAPAISPSRSTARKRRRGEFGRPEVGASGSRPSSSASDASRSGAERWRGSTSPAGTGGRRQIGDRAGATRCPIRRAHTGMPRPPRRLGKIRLGPDGDPARPASDPPPPPTQRGEHATEPGAGVADDEHVGPVRRARRGPLGRRAEIAGRCGVDSRQIAQFHHARAAAGRGQVERLAQDIAGRARGGRDHGALPPEQRVEERALPAFGSPTSTTRTVPSRCSRGDDPAETRRAGGRDLRCADRSRGVIADHILLIGEVDPGLDQREQFRGLVDHAAYRSPTTPSRAVRRRRSASVLEAMRRAMPSAWMRSSLLARNARHELTRPGPADGPVARGDQPPDGARPARVAGQEQVGDVLPCGQARAMKPTASAAEGPALRSAGRSPPRRIPGSGRGPPPTQTAASTARASGPDIRTIALADRPGGEDRARWCRPSAWPRERTPVAPTRDALAVVWYHSRHGPRRDTPRL